MVGDLNCPAAPFSLVLIYRFFFFLRKTIFGSIKPGQVKQQTASAPLLVHPQVIKILAGFKCILKIVFKKSKKRGKILTQSQNTECIIMAAQITFAGFPIAFYYKALKDSLNKEFHVFLSL